MGRTTIEELDDQLEPLAAQLDNAVEDCPRVARMLECSRDLIIGRFSRTPWERSRNQCLKLAMQVDKKLGQLSRLVSTSKLLELRNEVRRYIAACTKCRQANERGLSQGRDFLCSLEGVSKCTSR